MSKNFCSWKQKRVNPVSDDNDRQYGVLFTVMGIVGGGGIGDFAIRYGYQRYEYGVMYFSILVMIVAVLVFS